LDSLKCSIVNYLLKAEKPISAGSLAAQMAISPRVVRYNLPIVELWLHQQGAGLVRRRNVGLFLEITDEQRQQLLQKISCNQVATPLLPAAERETYLVLELLLSPGSIYISTLADQLGISNTTVTKELKNVEYLLEEQDLHLIRRPNSGLRISGSERTRRDVAQRLLLRQIGVDWILQIGQGTSIERLIQDADAFTGARRIDFLLLAAPLLQMLNLPWTFQFVERVGSELQIDLPEVPRAVLLLSIAIQILRIRQANFLTQHQEVLSVVDDPFFLDTTVRLADLLQAHIDARLPELEKSELALHVLSMEAQPPRLFSIKQAQNDIVWTSQIVDQMLIEIASKLDSGLSENVELREALLEYLTPAIYRIWCKFPLYNPQSQDIQRNYPDVFDAAHVACLHLEDVTHTPTPEEEIGYIAMCIIAAVEGGIRCSPNVVVICPLGIATSRMLISRLKAEFPSLQIVGAYSFDKVKKISLDSADLIITTAEVRQPSSLPDKDIIQVNPLLYPVDRMRILTWLEGYHKRKGVKQA
ncbi:MAG: PRD domain-containing protein, partial [Chloroflexi bacterium]|nr:PRD domain-containing protein [Chloroflexota bacterium]